MPALSIGALTLSSLGLLVLTIPTSSLRGLAMVPARAGFDLAATPRRYDIFINRDGAGSAIRSAGGQPILVCRPSDFVAEHWLRADGDGRASMMEASGVRSNATAQDALWSQVSA